MPPGNQGTLDLGIVDVLGSPIRDTVRTVVRRGLGDRKVLFSGNLPFPPRHVFPLPAFPQEDNLVCEISPTRWRMRTTGFFTLTDQEPITRNLTVLRQPRKWQPVFEPFGTLPVELAPLRQMLDQSPEVRVMSGGEKLGFFVGTVYDGVTAARTVLAKIGLLNVFAKLRDTQAPTAGNPPWSSFIEELLEIAPDRIIALVRPEMGDVVQKIRENIDSHPDYERAGADLHFANMPPRFGVAKSRMFSVKTTDEKGNLQLTLGPGTAPDGTTKVLVLDADIDENGEALAHALDVFKHKVTQQGTHPIDIHECLCLARIAPLGYAVA
jgi:hypothetical protein